jgi:hypothetical protein
MGTAELKTTEIHPHLIPKLLDSAHVNNYFYAKLSWIRKGKQQIPLGKQLFTACSVNPITTSSLLAISFKEFFLCTTCCARP